MSLCLHCFILFLKELENSNLPVSLSNCVPKLCACRTSTSVPAFQQMSDWSARCLAAANVLSTTMKSFANENSSAWTPLQRTAHNLSVERAAVGSLKHLLMFKKGQEAKGKKVVFDSLIREMIQRLHLWLGNRLNFNSAREKGAQHQHFVSEPSHKMMQGAVKEYTR